MSGEWLRRLVRRLAVVALTVGVIGIAIGTVQVAAQWRAESAPLDAAPVSMDTINAEATVETSRAAALYGQIADVEAQVGGLGDALAAAHGNVSGDTDSAQALQRQLDKAAARLKVLQGQLKAAQARLSQLNAAAARQAALNAAARSSGSGPAKAAPAQHEDEGDDDGH